MLASVERGHRLPTVPTFGARSRREMGHVSLGKAASNWLRTPPEIRERGGAVFGDHRFGTAWVYHNGAESCYVARGFRCMLRV